MQTDADHTNVEDKQQRFKIIIFISRIITHFTGRERDDPNTKPSINKAMLGAAHFNGANYEQQTNC